MKHRKKADKKRFLSLLDDLVPTNERLPPETKETAPKKHPKRGAAGKVVYSSEAAAKKAARSRLKRGSNTSKLRVYYCEKSKGWCMTSSIRKF